MNADAVAALRAAADAALRWLLEECIPDGAEYAAEGHLWNMSSADLVRAESVRDGLRAALATAPLPSEPTHPHDGFAYDGCKCVCCVNIRALANPAIIEERDRAEEWADRLAYAIGGAAIGEHSNLNNPWQNALDMAAPLPSDTPADGLDAAWREAEAALPEGWRGPVVRRSRDFPDQYWALAEQEHGDRFREGYAATPTMALRALAFALAALTQEPRSGDDR